MRLARAALIVTVLVPLAVTPAVAKAPKAPNGKYKLSGGGTGGFKVTDDKTVVKFSIKTDGTHPKCGTKVKIKGAMKLSNFTNAGYTAWIVGKHKASDYNDYRSIKVTYVVDGVEIKGKFKMIFDYDNVKRGNGYLNFGECVNHNFTHAKSS